MRGGEGVQTARPRTTPKTQISVPEEKRKDNDGRRDEHTNGRTKCNIELGYRPGRNSNFFLLREAKFIILQQWS